MHLSWVWISWWSTGRRSNIEGNGAKCTLQANMLVARFAILALVCTALNIYWAVPRPF